MSFKDQLKAWKDDHEVLEQGERERREAEARAAEAKAKAEAEARAAEAKARAEVSDEELFLQAVEGVERGEAILRKYDKSDPGRAPVQEDEDQPKDVRDKALFLQFVEEMGIDKKD